MFPCPQFSPLPQCMVGAHCRWEVKLDTVLNRIPSTITEIVCRDSHSPCGGNSNYRCRQIRARMVVAYTEMAVVAGGGETVAIVQKQVTKN